MTSRKHRVPFRDFSTLSAEDREMAEKNKVNGMIRDPQRYYFTVFGQPGGDGRWGLSIEGHHLSLNYTLDKGDVVSSTPEFFGTNPALIDAGPGRSIRVLGPEEDLARQVLKLCNAEQAKIAHVDTKAPDDLRVGALAPRPAKATTVKPHAVG